MTLLADGDVTPSNKSQEDIAVPLYWVKAIPEIWRNK